MIDPPKLLEVLHRIIGTDVMLAGVQVTLLFFFFPLRCPVLA